MRCRNRLRVEDGGGTAGNSTSIPIVHEPADSPLQAIVFGPALPALGHVLFDRARFAAPQFPLQVQQQHRNSADDYPSQSNWYHSLTNRPTRSIARAQASDTDCRLIPSSQPLPATSGLPRAGVGSRSVAVSTAPWPRGAAPLLSFRSNSTSGSGPGSALPPPLICRDAVSACRIAAASRPEDCGSRGTTTASDRECLRSAAAFAEAAGKPPGRTRRHRLLDEPVRTR